MKKLTAILLAALIFTAAGCGAAQESDAPVAAAETTAAENTPETDEEDTTPALPEPELPDMNYNGAPFVIYKREGDGRFTTYTFDELTGDVENDAVYYRNLAVEEKFGIDVQEVVGAGDTYGVNAKNTILAGDNAYQLVSAHARLSFGYPEAQLALDWYKLPYVDFDNEWWDKNMLGGMTIGGKLYVLPDDLSTSALEETKCFIFNKSLFDRYEIEYPYQSVRDGTFTFDKFDSMVSVFSDDINGDGVLDLESDQYGFSSTWWGTPINIIWTDGLRLVAATGEDGRLEIVLDESEADRVYTRMFQFFDENYAHLQLTDDGAVPQAAFRDGRLAVYETLINRIVQFRDVDYDIGCVPPPKFDESMTTYSTGVDAGCSGIIIPVTNTDTDMVSAVLEYWMYLQYRDVTPVYFETVCKTKSARDADTAEMLDIIRANRFYDIGYYLSSFTLNSIGHDLATTNKGFASFYASKLSSAQKSLDKINALYFDE